MSQADRRGAARDQGSGIRRGGFGSSYCLSDRVDDEVHPEPPRFEIAIRLNQHARVELQEA